MSLDKQKFSDLVDKLAETRIRQKKLKETSISNFYPHTYNELLECDNIIEETIIDMQHLIYSDDFVYRGLGKYSTFDELNYAIHELHTFNKISNITKYNREYKRLLEKRNQAKHDYNTFCILAMNDFCPEAHKEIDKCINIIYETTKKIYDIEREIKKNGN